MMHQSGHTWCIVCMLELFSICLGHKHSKLMKCVGHAQANSITMPNCKTDQNCYSVLTRKKLSYTQLPWFLLSISSLTFFASSSLKLTHIVWKSKQHLVEHALGFLAMFYGRAYASTALMITGKEFPVDII